MEKSDLDKIELWKQMLPDMELAEDQRKERAREFLRLMTYYKCAMMELETRINLLNEEYLLTHDRAPVSTIKTRLKTPQSIKEKLERQGLPFTYQAVMENLHDIAGVRVICAFTGDVYTLADALFRQDDIQLIRVKDYIAQPKPNGYRSLHMIVSVPIYLANENGGCRWKSSCAPSPWTVGQVWSTSCDISATVFLPMRWQTNCRSALA